jgi:PfaD family protein
VQGVIWETAAAREQTGANAARQPGENGDSLARKGTAELYDDEALEQALGQIDWPLLVVSAPGGRWQVQTAAGQLASGAFVPALRLESLGDASFRADHGLRYAYLGGAMANGIGSVEICEALGRAGMLAFFGAAGLPVAHVAKAVDRLQNSLGPTPFGFNLIHSPNEPSIEAAVVDLYLNKGIRLVEASAYLDLTLPVVRYRVHGIHRDDHGRVIAPNRIIAKVSRVEVASKFLAPPPTGLLRQLVARGDITEAQAELARSIPMAQDLTAEADSAGHTDNRPAITLLPTMITLRNRLQQQYGYPLPLRVGAAGGIATPAAAAAAFTMGAAYILTGSVNQACVESGSSDMVREMLAQAEQADVIMAPAADMFEMGVRLQVLKRGTLFAMRAAKLYEIYRNRAGLDDIPAAEREPLEKTIFRMPLAEVWRLTADFFRERDPSQLARAEKDPRHKMALVFRWYLGLSSRWANRGEPDRKIDYQVWCGPAMGAFNEWVKGSYLEQPRQRRVVPVALNILYGAAVLLRSQALRWQGLSLAPDRPRLSPLEPHLLEQRLT